MKPLGQTHLSSSKPLSLANTKMGWGVTLGRVWPGGHSFSEVSAPGWVLGYPRGSLAEGQHSSSVCSAGMGISRV